MTRARELSKLADANLLTPDTTNSRIGINSTSPAVTLDVLGDLTVSGSVRAEGGLDTSDAYRNTLLGENAGDSFTSGSAIDNTLLGYDAGTAISTGDYNTAVGSYALTSTTTASYNIAVGHKTLFNNITGAQNTAVGKSALYINSTGCLLYTSPSPRDRG